MNSYTYKTIHLLKIWNNSGNSNFRNITQGHKSFCNQLLTIQGILCRMHDAVNFLKNPYFLRESSHIKLTKKSKLARLSYLFKYLYGNWESFQMRYYIVISKWQTHTTTSQYRNILWLFWLDCLKWLDWPNLHIL